MSDERQNLGGVFVQRPEPYRCLQCATKDLELADLRRRLEAAEAIVAKLPKTADGVAMTLRMNFWVLHENHDTSIPWWEIIGAGVLKLFETESGDRVEYRDENGYEDDISAEKCYSTREAAENALASRGGAGGTKA